MGNLAIRSYMLSKENGNGQMEFFARKKLLWDGENMRITNQEEANQFVTRTYRKGWEVQKTIAFKMKKAPLNWAFFEFY